MHRHGREPERTETPQSAARALDIPGRRRVHRLYPEALRTMRTVGSFRVVNADDIPRDEQTRLIRDGLMQRAKLRIELNAPEIEVLTLTDEGKRVIESQQTLDDLQRYYNGFCRPVDLPHDTAVYPAYLKEIDEIQKAGGTVNRVMLDPEFRAHINSEREDYRRRAAAALKLKPVNEEYPIPDARIEYTDAEGREQHVDIEVVTRDYSRAQIAVKAAAGFKIHPSTDLESRKVFDSNTYNWI